MPGKNFAARENNYQDREPERRERLMSLALALAEEGATVRQMDQYAALSPGTIGTWSSRYMDFGNALDRARQRFRTNQREHFRAAVQSWETTTRETQTCLT